MNSKPVLVVVNFASFLCFAIIRRGDVCATSCAIRFHALTLFSPSFHAMQTQEVVLRVVAATTAIVLFALRSAM